MISAQMCRNARPCAGIAKNASGNILYNEIRAGDSPGLICRQVDIAHKPFDIRQYDEFTRGALGARIVPVSLAAEGGNGQGIRKTFP
ncbi:MAG: hypothetical protein JWQ23_376 [Herminiimonas sp.]|nr:hypothetical protein [Herminiimonas sp.]